MSSLYFRPQATKRRPAISRAGALRGGGRRDRAGKVLGCGGRPGAVALGWPGRAGRAGRLEWWVVWWLGGELGPQVVGRRVRRRSARRRTTAMGRMAACVQR